MEELAKEPEMKQKNKVMIAIDGSDSSSYALKWALQNLDDTLKSHGVILFTAISADYSGVFSGSVGSVRKFSLCVPRFLLCLMNFMKIYAHTIS